MTPARRNEPIATWSDGDAVQGFALLQRSELRQDRNGNSYLDVELADATGSITGKAWSDSPAAKAQVEAPSFVAFRGSVRRYREQLQLNLEECRVAGDDDRRFGFEESILVPTTREDVDDLWRRLEGALASIDHPHLRQLAEAAVGTHAAALREHPAAKAMHHAYRSGLLEHVVSMLELASKVCQHYASELSRDLVLVGVLFHDLGKIRELGALPGSDYTLEGRMVGHVVIGRDLLLDEVRRIADFPERLRVHLEHLVLSHQGQREYGAPVEPATAEALALHFIDDLDSKMNQFRRLRESGATFAYSRGLGRQVWLQGSTLTSSTVASTDPESQATGSQRESDDLPLFPNPREEAGA